MKECEPKMDHGKTGEVCSMGTEGCIQSHDYAVVHLMQATSPRFDPEAKDGWRVRVMVLLDTADGPRLKHKWSSYSEQKETAEIERDLAEQFLHRFNIEQREEAVA